MFQINSIERDDMPKYFQYFISIKDTFIMSDRGISEKLKISYEEYTNILNSYRAIKSKSYLEYFFDRKEDCLECIEYLENTYGILLAMEG